SEPTVPQLSSPRQSRGRGRSGCGSVKFLHRPARTPIFWRRLDMAKRSTDPYTPAARRIKRKILIAITLTAFLPMLVVAYLVYSYAFPLLDVQTQERDLPWMLVMLCGTG